MNKIQDIICIIVYILGPLLISPKVTFNFLNTLVSLHPALGSRGGGKKAHSLAKNIIPFRPNSKYAALSFFHYQHLPFFSIGHE